MKIKCCDVFINELFRTQRITLNNIEACNVGMFITYEYNEVTYLHHGNFMVKS